MDQLDRATESLVLNLVEGARLHSTPGKLTALDYAIGSGLECAGCLDIAGIKGFLGGPEKTHEKQRLCEIVKMLIGLRKAWQAVNIHEDITPYQADAVAATEILFHHETLEVYGAALKLMGWLASLPGGKALPDRLYRQIDEGVTSIILNIAEGNGRYSELDHHRFLDMAKGSAVKVAAYLDLAVLKLTLPRKECVQGKVLLERIVAMLSQM